MVLGEVVQAVGTLIKDLETEIGKALGEVDNPEIRMKIGIKTLEISINNWKKAKRILEKKIDPEKLEVLGTLIKKAHEVQELARDVTTDLFPAKED